jgi:hypothetical protein
MYFPSSDVEPLKGFLESLRKRHKSLKHQVKQISCDKVLEKSDTQARERLDVELWEPRGKKFMIRMMLWEDRFCWVDCRAPQKLGWAWEWSNEGRLLGEYDGRRLLELLERTLSLCHSMERSKVGEFGEVWRKVLAKGPKRLS